MNEKWGTDPTQLMPREVSEFFVHFLFIFWLCLVAVDGNIPSAQL